jgi:hypothetical protein
MMAHVEAIQHAKELLAQFNHYQAIQQLLADELAWQNLQNHNGRIFAALEAILAAEPSRKYPRKLYDNIFSILVFFTKCWPRNNFDHLEGQPRVYRCPFMLTPITNPVYTSMGLILEATNLPAILKYGKNPQTRQRLNPRDVAYMKARAAELKIAIPKTKREKFEWRDIFKSLLLASATLIILVLAFTVPPLLTGLLPLTFLAVPLIAAPLCYLATNFWFRCSTKKKVAGYNNKIKKLISLTDDIDDVAPSQNQQAVSPEYEIDQPGLAVANAIVSELAIIGEPDHPELPLIIGEAPEQPVSPAQNVIAVGVNTNRRFGMLSWLNRIEPELHKEEVPDERCAPRP